MPRVSQIDKIQRAAIDVFSKRGFDGTRIKHIAGEAKVSEGAIYKHYKSKNELASDLFIKNLNIVSNEILSIHKTNKNPIVKIENVLKYLIETYRKDRNTFKFLLMQNPTYLNKEIDKSIFPVTVISKIVIEAQNRQLIIEGDNNLITALLWGGLLQIISQYESMCLGNVLFDKDNSYDSIIINHAIKGIKVEKDS